MALVGLIIYNVKSADGSLYTSRYTREITDVKADSFDMLSNIFATYGASKVFKLGIQADPGIHFTLNENKLIIMGLSGIYELDEDLNITSLSFEDAEPENVIVDFLY